MTLNSREESENVVWNFMQDEGEVGFSTSEECSFLGFGCTSLQMYFSASHISNLISSNKS